MAAPTNKEKLLIQVLRKIPIFNGLAPTQVKKILGPCQHKSLQARRAGLRERQQA